MKLLRKEPLNVAIAAAALIWAVAFVAGNVLRMPDGRLFFWLFDDAMISMRYAWHFAHGYGLVWNPGEKVEGYTNFLLVLLMAPLHLVFPLRFAPLAFQFVNLLVGASVAWHLLGLMQEMAARLGIAETVSQRAKPAALFLLLSYYPFLYWTLLGMEPALITLFCVLLVRNLVSVPSSERKITDDLKLAAFQILAVLCRPDSVLFVVPLWLGFTFYPRRPQSFSRVAVVPGLLFASVVLHTLFRKTYYGDWVPNTFYLKTTGLTLSEKLQNGYAFLSPFFAQAIALVFVNMACAVKGPARSLAVAGLTVLGISLGYQLWIGGDSFLGLWRFMVPAMPFLFAGAAFFLAKVIEEKVSSEAKGITLAVMTLSTAAWLNASFLQWLALEEPPGKILAHHFMRTADGLNEVLKPAASVGVFSAGILPYYLPHLRAVDFLGKNDKIIARTRPHMVHTKGLITLPGHNKYNLSYSILKLKPTYVEFIRWFDDDVTEPARSLYSFVRYRDLGLLLLTDSPLVNRSLLQPTSK